MDGEVLDLDVVNERSYEGSHYFNKTSIEIRKGKLHS
jgi:hypothetical protein